MLNIPAIGMATFARFYDAPASGKAKVIKDARTFWANHDGYRQRAYYSVLRNTLTQTHWTTNELSDFESAIDEMLSKVTVDHRRENYDVISRAYLRFWARQDSVQLFKIPPTRIEISGLTILINPDIGMRRPGNILALKLWLAGKPPKRSYRQAIQYLVNEAKESGWRRDLQPAIWDIRREEIMPSVQFSKDFALVIRGQAAAFLEMWNAAGIGQQSQSNGDEIDLTDA